MTLEEAQAKLQERVYAATKLIEELEAAGSIPSNGHQARLNIAEFAKLHLKEHWKDE